MTQQTNNQNNLHVAQMEYDNQKKTPGIAYALWFFLGGLGGHRFYAGAVQCQSIRQGALVGTGDL